jgi:hypothetical protein
MHFANDPSPQKASSSQLDMNRSTRGQWAMYGSHRREIERLIAPTEFGGRACVLGAGNCNDLDLNWMTQAFAGVHLLDLDEQSLTAGVNRQHVSRRERIHVRAPVDLMGLGDLLPALRGRATTQSDIETCIARLDSEQQAAAMCRIERASADLVLSPCVLSQLIISVRDRVGSDHPAYPLLRAAIMRQHLRMMMYLLRPDGRGVLVIDVASSEDFPELARVADESIGDLMRTLIADGKCFRALAPAALSKAMAGIPAIADVRFTRPWRWHLGLRKAFVVYGICFRATGDSLPSHSLQRLVPGNFIVL